VKRQISCSEYQGAFIEALARGPGSELSADVSAHLALCSECRATSLDLEAGWDAFRDLQPVEPPQALRERTRGAVLALMSEERASASRRRWLDGVQVPLAVGSARAGEQRPIWDLGSTLGRLPRVVAPTASDRPARP